MTRLNPTLVVSILLVSCALAAAPPERGRPEQLRNPDAKDASHLTGVLKSVDVRHRTLTLDNVGVDVDDALSRKLRERARREGVSDAKPGPAEADKTQVVAIDAKTKIYVKFRSSPSVGNQVEHPLNDLEPMVGWPVTVGIGHKGEPLVASEVIAWRGTPWKISGIIGPK